MKITLKDGSVREFQDAMSAADICKSISEGLYRNACVCRIDGETADLRTVIDRDAALEFLTFDDEDGRRAFRHTASHIMAQAVKRLYPGVKLAIGPAIADGFYYDFDSEPGLLTSDKFAEIEEEMKKIVKEDLTLRRFTLPKDEAISLMKEKNEPYKVELIESLPEGEEISFYEQGEYVDLCAGPHIESTKAVKAFKLLSVAGAYWHGDEHNKMLTRIYGTAFRKQSELDEYITRIEEAKKRDHRKLGRELELFTLMDEGPGFPFFLPKGMILRNTLIDYWRQIHLRENYLEISTPIILNRKLWETSGHWDHYKNNMYTTVIDEEDYAIKPMNCPGSMLVYKSKPRSYKELPLRLAELGLVHRHEKSGQLHGLMRVRCFTQDDGHIYLSRDQISEEIKRIVKIIDGLYSLFGFKYHVELSTRPEDSMGSDEDWDQAIGALKDALDQLELPYVINEGDGAFYGPKIDFHLEDSIGRTWQCGTIQLDFQLPLRFEAEYVGQDGERHTPILIHRVVFGSVERFIGILIEHFAGKFPTWLSPVQVRILPVSEKYSELAAQINSSLRDSGLRTETDLRSEKVGYKIREAIAQKIPYVAVVGENELQNGTVTVRRRGSEKQESMALADFIAEVREKIETKAND